jgi:hypothetical protein
MPRADRHAAESHRPGPYEHAYDVLRGYDAPPPAVVRAAGPVPVMVASRREDRDDRGRRRFI